MPARLGSTGGVCVCVRGKGERVVGGPATQPRRAPPRLLQAGETQAHVGAPLRHELVQARAAG